MDWIREAGLLALIQLGVLPLGLCWALVLAVLAGMGWRPPAFLWWVWIPVEIGLGATSQAIGASNIERALVYADPENTLALSAVGYSEALTAPVLGWASAGLLALVSAGLLSVATPIGAGKPARWTPLGALVGPAVALVTAIAWVGWAFAMGIRPSHLLSSPTPWVLLVGAGILLPAGLRVGEEPADVPRTAAARATVAALYWSGALLIGVAALANSERELFRAVFSYIPDPADKAWLWGLTAADEWLSRNSLVWLAVGAGVAAAASALRMAPQLGNGRAFLGALGSALIGIAGLALGGWGGWASSGIRDAILRSDSVEVLSSFQHLPTPHTSPGDLRANCIVAASRAGWEKYPAGEALDCQAGTLVLPTDRPFALALQADRPAVALAQETWSSGELSLAIITRSEGFRPTDWLHPLMDIVPYHQTDLHWVPANVVPPAGLDGLLVPPLADTLLVLDRPEGAQLVAPSGTYPVPDLKTLGALGSPSDWKTGRLLVIPGEHWTVQDLVILCSEAASHELPCALQDSPAMLAPPPEVEPPPVASGGPADAMGIPGIKEAIDASKGSFQYCYERQLKRNPDLHGSVTIEWSIEGGKTTRARATHNTTGNADLGPCLVERIERVKFPNVTLDVTRKFVFSPG